jgi:hypothetical protein
MPKIIMNLISKQAIMNTELTPQYDIVPHGVKRTADGVVNMVFKMSVTFSEFNAEGGIDLQMWKAVSAKVDTMQWGYKIGSGTIQFVEILDHQGLNLQLLKFRKGQLESASFGFGKSEKNLDAFDFLATGGFALGPAAVKPKILQMERENGDNIPLGAYDDILKKAGEYGKAQKIALSKTKKGYKDFKSIYASILDDTQMAERGFGLVRTIFIPIEDSCEFINKSYSISVLGIDSGDIYKLEKLGEGKSAKFYNGLAAKYFTNDDFAKIMILDYDAYKGNLAKEKANDLRNPGKTDVPDPDGAYVMAMYNIGANGIIDPFDNEAIKGLNAVVKFKGVFHSLSYHQSQINTKVGGRINFKYNTSGVLTPRSVLDTASGAYRNNILFAWRGDNLLVNRINREEDDENMSEKVSGWNQNEDESVFISKDLFEKTDRLVPGSQLQLLFSQADAYKFFARRVSTTGYCIPLPGELDKADAEYTLTMEDDLRDAALELAAQIKEYLQDKDGTISLKEFYFKDRVRIKSSSIAGPIKYESAPHADQTQQIVLNLLSGEIREKRSVFPPQIKFEDLKFLGYLTRDKLLAKKNEQPTLSQLVSRCIALEGKIKKKPPILSAQIQNVDYLADPRGKYIYLYGSDYSTGMKFGAALIPAFSFDAYHPIFSKTASVELIVEAKNGVGVLKMNSLEKSNLPVWPALTKGVYDLNIYVTDRPVNPLETVSYNPVKFKISILDYPDKPEVKNRRGVIRDTRFANYWFAKVIADKSIEGAKSLKYLEKRKVLRLSENNNQAKNLLKSTFSADEIKKLELFETEYPYEVFLQTEGGFEEKNGLLTNIYPNLLRFYYQVEPDQKLSGDFFSWKLNDEDLLQARFDMEGSVILFLSGEELFRGPEGTIQISFEESSNQYFIRSQSDDKKHYLKKYLYQQLSIRDVILPENILRWLQHGKDSKNKALKFKIEPIKDYVFIAAEQHPFYQQKQLKLFSSSMFQAYYPNVKGEFGLGAIAEGQLDYVVPNNTKPEPPVLEYEKIFKRKGEDGWESNFKSCNIESLVRIILQDDYMKEGQNKLGIVLQAMLAAGEFPLLKTSLVGEDITKITANPSLKDLNVEKVINNKNRGTLLKKYISAEAIKYYKIGSTVYKVLECIPFFDAQLKKWQIVLSFDLIRTETMFLKLYTLKISPGHGLSINPGSNSPANPYKDTTGTNLSILSDPCEFPIYNKKTFSIERKLKESEPKYIISIDTISDYRKNIYFIMMMRGDINSEILNLTESLESKNDSMVPFSYFTDTPSGPGKSSKGKILKIVQPKVPVMNKIGISAENCNAIVMLEFEVHDNAEMDFTEHFSFVDHNPLFDYKGIRLINAVEFKTK